MIWHIPPELAGQIIEVSYAADNGIAYKKILDKSDLSIELYSADLSDCGCENECDCFQPWNNVPLGFNWSPCKIDKFTW